MATHARFLLFIGLMAGLLGGCVPATITAIPTESPTLIEPTPLPTLLPTPTSTPLPATLSSLPEDWKTWPVIPVVTGRVREIYLRGQELGNDPHALSIMGDCQSLPETFLGLYATDVGALPSDLQETAAWFADSFVRQGPTAKTGATAGALLWTEWHEGKYGCQSTETPVDCELRLHRPSFAIINLGTHYESRNLAYLREIIDTLIEHGVVPILATKADNRELDERLNYESAQLAVEYGLPLWNFWAATNDLPNHGLYTKKGDEHLGDIYLNDEALKRHRLTALQSLDAVWRVAIVP